MRDSILGDSAVVFANAKILILKLITTLQCYTNLCSCCICQCKDTNFKANHNPVTQVASEHSVVFANAKILILKLITTYNGVAIFVALVVFANAKILILKLITTASSCACACAWLYLPMQRY